MRSIFKIVIPGLLFVVVASAVYAGPAADGVGSIAWNMLEPISVLNDFITTACYIIGGSLLFAALIKYFQHRVNPFAVPISTVVWLVLFGLGLICLPLAYKLAYSEPPASATVQSEVVKKHD